MDRNVVERRSEQTVEPMLRRKRLLLRHTHTGITGTGLFRDVGRICLGAAGKSPMPNVTPRERVCSVNVRIKRVRRYPGCLMSSGTASR